MSHKHIHKTELTFTINALTDNHVTMVQRMIGGKIGTGGSSGYQYLRATVRCVCVKILLCVKIMQCALDLF